MTHRQPPEKDFLVIHRDYRYRGGEEVFLDEQLLPALDRVGATFDILRFPALRRRDAAEIAGMILGLERARPSYHRIRRAIDSGNYRAVLFNNFIPTISLRAPELCKERGLRVLHWVHNSRLGCANGLSFDGEKICSACFDQGSRSAITRACFPSKAQAMSYASVYRSRRVARVLGSSIDEWIVSAEYSAKQIDRIAEALMVPMRTRTIRMVPKDGAPQTADLAATIATYIRRQDAPYFLFVGRLSFEKGADRFLELAKLHPAARFAMAGKGPMLDDVRANAPSNVTIFGYVSAEERQALIAGARALVIPSRAPENSPVVLFESHFALTPVFYTSGGGAEEVAKWLGRDARPIEEFAVDLQLERRGREFGGTEFVDSVAALSTSFALRSYVGKNSA